MKGTLREIRKKVDADLTMYEAHVELSGGLVMVFDIDIRLDIPTQVKQALLRYENNMNYELVSDVNIGKEIETVPGEPLPSVGPFTYTHLDEVEEATAKDESGLVIAHREGTNYPGLVEKCQILKGITIKPGDKVLVCHINGDAMRPIIIGVIL